MARYNRSTGVSMAWDQVQVGLAPAIRWDQRGLFWSAPAALLWRQQRLRLENPCARLVLCPLPRWLCKDGATIAAWDRLCRGCPAMGRDQCHRGRLCERSARRYANHRNLLRLLSVKEHPQGLSRFLLLNRNVVVRGRVGLIQKSISFFLGGPPAIWWAKNIYRAGHRRKSWKFDPFLPIFRYFFFIISPLATVLLSRNTNN